MARTLATMVESRLPVMEGLALTVPTIHNRVLRAATDEIVESVRGGGSLSAAMRRADVFPPLLVYLAASGESAGQLDMMLERAADYLEREFDAFTSAGAFAAGTCYHHRHGRRGRDHHPVDPAADHAAAKPDWNLSS